MMVYRQLYRSVAVLRAQCKPGSVIACFEVRSHIFHSFNYDVAL